MNKLKNIVFCGVLGTRFLFAENYVEIKSGLGAQSDCQAMCYKTTYCFSGEVGHSFDAWRLGVQFGQHTFKSGKTDGVYNATIFNCEDDIYSNGKFKVLAALLNAYYDHKIQDNLSAYIGVGFGISNVKYHFYEQEVWHKDFNLSKNALCGQVMTGVTYAINSNWALSLGYRCMKTETVYYSHPDFEAGADIISLKTPFLHSLELGLRYSF